MKVEGINFQYKDQQVQIRVGWSLMFRGSERRSLWRNTLGGKEGSVQ